MTITLTRKHLVAGLAALAVIAATLVWLALPETCDHWADRYVQSLAHSIYGGADDRAAARIVLSQRPNGCNR